MTDSKKTTQFTQAHLFVDINKKSSKSWEVIDHLERNLKAINYNGFIIEVVPVGSKKDKEVLYGNGVTHLPTLLYNQNQTVGANKINVILGKIARVPSKKMDAREELRNAQLSEMDMDKLENGDYDDEDNYDDDEDVFVGDQDAVKQNLHKRLKDFQKKRSSRVDNPLNKKGKKNRNRKKPSRNDYDYDSDEGEQVEARRPQKRQGGGGGGGGGKPKTAALKMEDWDAETQQLLDKGGTDW